MPKPRHLALGILAVWSMAIARVVEVFSPGSGRTARRAVRLEPATRDRGRRTRAHLGQHALSAWSNRPRCRPQPGRVGCQQDVAKRQGAGCPRRFCQSLSGRPVACTTSQPAHGAGGRRLQARDDLGIALGKARAEGSAPIASQSAFAGREAPREQREWRKCPASACADRGPSRRTGSALAARDLGRARSRQRAADRVSLNGSTP
jgi:hypothetical protein